MTQKSEKTVEVELASTIEVIRNDKKATFKAGEKVYLTESEAAEAKEKGLVVTPKPKTSSEEKKKS